MRSEIFKAINAVSCKVNDMSQKLDEVMQTLNSNANEKISVNAGGIDGLGEVVDINAGGIDGLATALDEVSTALDDVGVMLADFDERITNLESEVIK